MNRSLYFLWSNFLFLPLLSFFLFLGLSLILGLSPILKIFALFFLLSKPESRLNFVFFLIFIPVSFNTSFSLSTLTSKRLISCLLTGALTKGQIIFPDLSPITIFFSPFCFLCPEYPILLPLF